MNCNAQLVINLIDWRLAAQPAISAPRIDCSTAELLLSWRFPPETAKALRAMGHRVGIRDERLFTGASPPPTAIRRTLDGIYDGGADPYYAPPQRKRRMECWSKGTDGSSDNGRDNAGGSIDRSSGVSCPSR